MHTHKYFTLCATQIGTDRASVKEYIRLTTAALALCKEGDNAAIAQLRPLAVAAVTDFIRRWVGGCVSVYMCAHVCVCACECTCLNEFACVYAHVHACVNVCK